mmetsp:Transcript_6276/g.10652  ORF Transcript_6276/g.10652 Transcript_6276/m.10652 type:complete len:107 (-) Transcript_6276:11-331(-)
MNGAPLKPLAIKSHRLEQQEKKKKGGSDVVILGKKGAGGRVVNINLTQKSVLMKGVKGILRKNESEINQMHKSMMEDESKIYQTVQAPNKGNAEDLDDISQEEESD